MLSQTCFNGHPTCNSKEKFFLSKETGEMGVNRALGYYS